MVQAQVQPVTTKAATEVEETKVDDAATTTAVPVATTVPVTDPITQQDSDVTVLPDTAGAGSHPAATPPPAPEAPPASDPAPAPTDGSTPTEDPRLPRPTHD